MVDENNERAMGRVEARQDASDERLERIEKKVDALTDSMAMARGGIRMMIAVGSVAATIGAFASTMLHWAVGK